MHTNAQGEAVLTLVLFGPSCSFMLLVLKKKKNPVPLQKKMSEGCEIGHETRTGTRAESQSNGGNRRARLEMKRGCQQNMSGVLQ